MRTEENIGAALLEDRPGGPYVAGTRISVYMIYHYLDKGETDYKRIARVLRIRDEQVLAALAYIEAHKDQVLTVHHQIEGEIARGNPAWVQTILEESHKKLMAKAEKRRKQHMQQETARAVHHGGQ